MNDLYDVPWNNLVLFKVGPHSHHIPKVAEKSTMHSQYSWP